MNPVKKLMSWLRGPSDPESVEAEHLRQDRNTIRISQNTPMGPLGSPTNIPPTSDVLDPGSEDDRT
jgi:hypothetical protein